MPILECPLRLNRKIQSQTRMASIYGFLNDPFWGQKHSSKALKWSDIGRNIMHSNNLLRSDPTYDAFAVNDSCANETHGNIRSK